MSGLRKDAKYPNPEIEEICYIKNCVSNPNIIVGDYSYYDDKRGADLFEKHVTHHYDFIGDKLIIGKFCQIASGVKFIMGPANHRLCSVTTYPFNVFGGVWSERTPPHMEQLPRKSDTIVGSDVWLGRESVVMPGVKIGDGAIIAAYSVVAGDVPPYTLYGGNPARFIKKRFDDALTALLLRLKWWDLPSEELAELLPLLCDSDLERVRAALEERLS